MNEEATLFVESEKQIQPEIELNDASVNSIPPDYDYGLGQNSADQSNLFGGKFGEIVGDISIGPPCVPAIFYLGRPSILSNDFPPRDIAHGLYRPPEHDPGQNLLRGELGLGSPWLGIVF